VVLLRFDNEAVLISKYFARKKKRMKRGRCGEVTLLVGCYESRQLGTTVTSPNRVLVRNTVA
jgi:hypothetical protein